MLMVDATLPLTQSSPSKPASGRKGPGPSTPRGGTTVLSERTLPLGQTLTVIKGSILDVKADAYVHPTNASFNLGGQVGELTVCVESVGRVCIESSGTSLSGHGWHSAGMP